MLVASSFESIWLTKNSLAAFTTGFFGSALMEMAMQAVRESLNDFTRLNVPEPLRTILLNPCSKIHEAYDLTKEDDIGRFLSWFAIWQRPVPDRLIRGLEKRRYQEPGQLDLFKEKVEKHNEKYAVTLEEDDDVDEIESDEVCDIIHQGITA